MKVRPLHNKVLIKILDTQETTKGGIIIPDTAKETPQQGQVVAVGNGRILEDGSTRKLDVKKGDKVRIGECRKIAKSVSFVVIENLGAVI